MAKTGAPSKYSKELVDSICETIAISELGLHDICANNADYPSVSTIMRWLNEEDKKDFKEKYARAKELQADFMASQILDIADDSENDTIHIQIRNMKGEVVETKDIENKEWTNRSKLRVDTRKWLMSKLAPKKYGDKLELDGKMETTHVIPESTLDAIVSKLNENAAS